MSKLGIRLLKYSALIGIVVAGILITTYLYIFGNEFDNLKANAKSTAVEAVKVINGDKFQAFAKEGGNKSEEFKDTLNSLLLFKAKTTSKNIYTLIKKDDKTLQFVVDASPEPADFLEEYESYDKMEEAFSGNTTVDDESTTDKWGSTISAFVPIENSAGKVVGILGVDHDTTSFQNIRSQLLKMGIAALAFFFISFLVVMLLFSKKLKDEIKIIQGNLNEVEQGDLSRDISIKTKDEIEVIGKSINEFKLKVSNIIKLIKQNSENIFIKANELSEIAAAMACSSQQVAGAVENVNQGANVQADNLLKVSETLNNFDAELGSMILAVKDIDRNSREVNSMAQVSNENMQSLMESVGVIESSFEDFMGKIQRVGEDVGRINEITNVINGISEQTNLLALNASIEAARAGEQGRGFAVVADEIRKLAEQSKHSSEKINLLVNSISVNTSTMINTTGLMNTEIHEQAGIIGTTIHSFKAIVAALEEMIPKINAVDDTAELIGREKGEILKSIEGISAVAMEVSASTEEILASTEEMDASTGDIAAIATELDGKTSELFKHIDSFKLHD